MPRACISRDGALAHACEHTALARWLQREDFFEHLRKPAKPRGGFTARSAVKALKESVQSVGHKTGLPGDLLELFRPRPGLQPGTELTKKKPKPPITGIAQLVSAMGMRGPRHALASMDLYACSSQPSLNRCPLLATCRSSTLLRQETPSMSPRHPATGRPRRAWCATVSCRCRRASTPRPWRRSASGSRSGRRRRWASHAQAMANCCQMALHAPSVHSAIVTAAQ